MLPMFHIVTHSVVVCFNAVFLTFSVQVRELEGIQFTQSDIGNVCSYLIYIYTQGLL